jgi:hypothetical protein
MIDEQDTTYLLTGERLFVNRKLKELQQEIKVMNRAINVVLKHSATLNRAEVVELLETITTITNRPQKALTMVKAKL